MIDIEDVTFIIPVRIESNDRFRNLILSVNYLLKNTNAKIIIMESDEKQLVPKVLNFILKNNDNNDDFVKRINYIFESSKEKMFHRTRILNNMLMESKTPIVVNYDCDVVLPLDSYQKATEMCRGDFDLVYPYSFGDNAQMRVLLNNDDVTNFIEKPDVNLLRGPPWRAEYGFCQFFKKQAYFNGFMENEVFFFFFHTVLKMSKELSDGKN